ncbi:MAG: enoyl-CoA hydratase [Methylocystis sp.]
MTIFANERDSESVSLGTSEPDQDRQAEERRIPGDADFKCKSGSLELNRLEGGDVLVVSKLHPGFDDECVDDLTRLLSAISAGWTARPKYLVFDFAHRRVGEASGSAGFQNLVAANSELILDAPVITVAWVRSFMAGADFEFACHCAMLVAERGALFSFDGDPDKLFGLYASLARKIGLVKTQGLLETGAALGAEDMHNLLLAKDVVEPRGGLAAIGDYMRQCGRRYNAAYAIFRAQRSVMNTIGLPAEGRTRA